MTQPNILWICTDQQRWDTLTCTTPGIPPTPHIDGLAAQGVAFRRAYAQSPICTPSRSSFLTGMYPIAHQVQRNGNDHFPQHLQLVPKCFADAGYQTGLIGKLHLSAAHGRVERRTADGYDEFYWSHYPAPEWPSGHDYADWLTGKGQSLADLLGGKQGVVYDGIPTEHHQTTWAKKRAQSFIRRHAGKPWLLSINVFDPHPPFDPPSEYMQRIDPARVPPPVFRPSDLAHQARFTGVDQQTKAPADPTAPFDPATARPSQGASHDTPPPDYDAPRLRAAYFAMIALIDDMVGELLATLDETGQRQNTLVIFMSDHGEMLGDHGLLYKGCRFYEGLVHVPLVISWPARAQQGGLSDALVELVDLPATLLEAAGLAVPHQNQGRSLLPLLEGKTSAHKDYVLSEYFDAIQFPGSIGSRGSMYFDGRYKLSLYHDANEGELFDLQSDPGEFDDLWHRPEAAALKLDLTRRHMAAVMKVCGIGPERVAAY